MGTVNPAANLHAWAVKVLAQHVCMCDACKAARAVLEATVRAEKAKLT